MSDRELEILGEALRRSNEQTATDVLNIWFHGSTNPRLVSVEFCAADFVVEVLPS
jgi:hypothetical protein